MTLVTDDPPVLSKFEDPTLRRSQHIAPGTINSGQTSSSFQYGTGQSYQSPSEIQSDSSFPAPPDFPAPPTSLVISDRSP